MPAASCKLSRADNFLKRTVNSAHTENQTRHSLKKVYYTYYRQRPCAGPLQVNDYLQTGRPSSVLGASGPLRPNLGLQSLKPTMQGARFSFPTFQLPISSLKDSALNAYHASYCSAACAVQHTCLRLASLVWRTADCEMAYLLPACASFRVRGLAAAGAQQRYPGAPRPVEEPG